MEMDARDPMAARDIAEIVADYLADRDDIASAVLRAAVEDRRAVLEVVTQGGTFFTVAVEAV